MTETNTQIKTKTGVLQDILNKNKNITPKNKVDKRIQQAVTEITSKKGIVTAATITKIIKQFKLLPEDLDIAQTLDYDPNNKPLCDVVMAAVQEMLGVGTKASEELMVLLYQVISVASSRKDVALKYMALVEDYHSLAQAFQEQKQELDRAHARIEVLEEQAEVQNKYIPQEVELPKMTINFNPGAEVSEAEINAAKRKAAIYYVDKIPKKITNKRILSPNMKSIQTTKGKTDPSG